MAHAQSLQVTYLWRGQILAYHLLGRRDRVTIGRRVLLCALPLLVLLLWIVALSSLATAGSTATASSPARMAVHIPQGGAGVTMLEVSLSVVRKPPAGQLGAVVRFKRPGGAAVEVGRVTIVGSGQSYQFNVTGSLSAGGAGEVEVAVIDRGGGPAPSGAELSIGRAEIVTR